MNLLRATGRGLLATYFIANGARALKDPDALVPATEPLARRFVPLAQKTLPEAVSAYVPEETKTIVRMSGLAGIVGGLGMATGIASKSGAALAAASLIPRLAASDPRGAPDRKKALFDLLETAALAGAALVVSQDTRGRPSMFWRAGDSAQRLQAGATKAVADVQTDAKKLSRRAQRQLDRATKQAAKRLDAAAKDVRSVWP